MSPLVIRSDGYLLVISGLEDDDAALKIIALCRHCRRELTRRMYRVGPGSDARALGALAEAHAVADGLRGLAHHCGERN